MFTVNDLTDSKLSLMMNLDTSFKNKKFLMIEAGVVIKIGERI